MALINPLKNVTLTSLLKWNVWDNKLKTKAKNNDLWAHIDPITNNKKLLKKPTKPKTSDFPKYIHQNR